VPDPFIKVQQNDPVSFSTIRENAVRGSARDWLERQQRTGGRPLDQTFSGVIVPVKNQTGAALDRGNIVGLGDPIFTPDDSTLDAFLQGVTFRGFFPDTTKHKRKYAVLLEPANFNQVARAYVAGVCQVLVNQQDEEHEYANITNGSVQYLTSSVHGHARILWREGLQGSGYGYYNTGIQWAVVMLGVTGSCVAVGKSNGPISARSGSTFGTGTVDIYRSNAGAYDGPIESVSVLNASSDEAGYIGSIADDLFCAVAWDWQDVAWVSPLECNPS
jgi:hypothetical protein